MFTVKLKSGLYLSTKGGGVTVASHKQIKWYEAYVTAAEAAIKNNGEPFAGMELLNEVIEKNKELQDKLDKLEDALYKMEHKVVEL